MRRRVHEPDEGGELNIVPYLDIVTNLVMFILLSMSGLITFGILSVDAPKQGSAEEVAAAAAEDKGPKLTLTVAITDRGFYVAGAGGVLDASATPGGPPNVSGEPTVPKRAGQYDYAGLTKKMTEIKTTFPDEQQIILLGEANVPYDVVIQVMDATREQVTGSGLETVRKPLFPRVLLSTLVQ